MYMAAEFNEHHQILLACSAQDSKLLPKQKPASTEQVKLHNAAIFEARTGRKIPTKRKKLSDGI